MSCLARACCVKNPPVGNENLIILAPTPNSACVGGLFNCYSEKYPKQLSSYMSQHDFENAINEINDSLQAAWPCCCCESYKNNNPFTSCHLFPPDSHLYHWIIVNLIFL